jgi:Rhodanese-like domain
VQWITTRERADWLEDRHRPPPVLLDVRTVEEWNVSHLPGARRVDPGTSAEMGLPGAARDVPVVTYCVVGYRSAEFYHALACGRFHTRAKSGGLHFPVGEYPFVSDGVPVSRVHP